MTGGRKYDKRPEWPRTSYVKPAVDKCNAFQLFTPGGVSWDPDTAVLNGGRLFSTSMSILALESYYRFSPLMGKQGDEKDEDDKKDDGEKGDK